MFTSLFARVAAIGLVVIVALASLAGLLVDASYRTSESFRWVTHSAEVIEVTDEVLADLQEAESGQRGFVLTQNAAYARSFATRVDSASKNIDRVVRLVADNPLQHTRAQEIAALIKQRTRILQQPLDLGRRGNFAAATAMIAGGRGLELMDAITVRAKAFLDGERAFQTSSAQQAERRLARGKWLALAGASLVCLMVLVGFTPSCGR